LSSKCEVRAPYQSGQPSLSADQGGLGCLETPQRPQWHVIYKAYATKMKRSARDAAQDAFLASNTFFNCLWLYILIICCILETGISRDTPARLLGLVVFTECLAGGWLAEISTDLQRTGRALEACSQRCATQKAAFTSFHLHRLSCR